MEKQVRNNWNPAPIKHEENTGEVYTKPNGAQSVREILFRNTQGMAYDNYKTPFYEEQAEFSSTSMNVIQGMDLSEKLQFLKETKANATALEKKIKDYKAQQDALAVEKAAQDRALLEAQNQTSTNQ